MARIMIADSDTTSAEATPSACASRATLSSLLPTAGRWLTACGIVLQIWQSST